jgi:hypothetical protein
MSPQPALSARMKRTFGFGCCADDLRAGSLKKVGY